MQATSFNPEIMKASRFLALSQDAKLVYLYLATSESNAWGLFELNEDYLQVVTGVIGDQFRSALDELSSAGYLRLEGGYALLPKHCPNSTFDPSKSGKQRRGLENLLFPLRHLAIAGDLLKKFVPDVPPGWNHTKEPEEKPVHTETKTKRVFKVAKLEPKPHVDSSGGYPISVAVSGVEIDTNTREDQPSEEPLGEDGYPVGDESSDARSADFEGEGGTVSYEVTNRGGELIDNQVPCLSHSHISSPPPHSDSLRSSSRGGGAPLDAARPDSPVDPPASSPPAGSETARPVPGVTKRVLKKQPARITKKLPPKYPFKTDGSDPALDELQLAILTAHRGRYPDSPYAVKGSRGGVAGKLRGNLRHILKSHPPDQVLGGFLRYLESPDPYYRVNGHPWEAFSRRVNSWVNPPSEAARLLASQVHDALPEALRSTFVNGYAIEWAYSIDPLLSEQGVEKVREVVLWAVKDEYWRPTVMDAKSFSKRFPSILAQSKAKKKGSSLVLHTEDTRRAFAPENLVNGMPREVWERSQRRIAEAVAREAARRAEAEQQVAPEA